MDATKTGKSIRKNYFFNLFYQVFLIITPLVVTPYISRVLTPEGIGTYSFSFSLITYFTIFGNLGFTYYAQRAIAKHQGDIEAQSRVFWEINICRLFPVFLSLIVNITLCSLNAYGNYLQLMWIFNINIIALAFDIAFLYQGTENFGKLVIRNFFVKIITIFCIFLFVKKESDLWIYTLINASSVFISSISMWMMIKKYICKIQFSKLNVFRHLPGTILLFLPTIATSIYTVLDKTLIGFIITDTYEETITEVVDGIPTTVTVIKKFSDLENGYYSQSEKLVKMAMTVILAIGTVMIPRNSHEVSTGNIEKIKENIKTSMNVVMLVGLPMMFGLIGISSNLVPWFLGENYSKCILLIRILSPLILIIGMSNIFGLQFLIPIGKDKKFTFAVVSGALINLILNIFFIKIWWSVGAAISTITAEMVVTALLIFMSRKEIHFFKIFFSGWKYILSSLIMFCVVFLLSNYLNASIINTLYLIFVGIIIYFIVLLLLREKMIMDIISKLIKKFFPYSKKIDKRDKTLDILKIFATFGVVLMHTVNKNLSTFNFFLYCFGVLSIPIFFMVDGALLLNRRITFKYCFKKIFSLLTLVFFWATIGFVFQALKNKSLNNWYLDLFGWFIQKGFSDIFWFFGTLLLLYLLLPLLKYIYNKKILFYLLISFLLVSCLCIYSLSIFTSVKEGYIFETKIIQTFRLYNWLLYFMIGGFVYKNKDLMLKHYNFIYMIFFIVISALFSFISCRYAMPSNSIEYLYCSPIIIISSFYVFRIVISFKLYSKNIPILSRATMTVYLFHQTFALRFFMHFNPNVVFVWCLTPVLIFSLLIFSGIILTRIKFTRKFVTL